MLLLTMTAKHYDLRVDGQILWDLAEGEITAFFRNGRISSLTPCRLCGCTEWQNVNEYFPLLKYETCLEEASPATQAVAHHATEPRLSFVPQWKVGVSCFAAGLLCAGTFTMLPQKVISSALSQPRTPSVVHAQPLEPAPVSDDSVHVQGTTGSARTAQASPSRSEAVSSRSSATAPGATQSSSPVFPPLTSKSWIRPEEATISLGKWTMVKSPYGSFRVKIRDEGSGSIAVWLDRSGEPRRIEKVKGFDATGSNIALIHSLPGAKVYYVDRLNVPNGSCVLKVIPTTWEG